MERKDYRKLLDMHSGLLDRRLLYKKELRDFIEKSFEKHGDVFEYKCKTHRSWKDVSEDEEACFFVADDLPVCLSDCNMDIYPVVLRMKRYNDGRKVILVDGFNWTEDEWQKNRKILESDSNLEAMADFIKDVLEQEQEDL